MNLTKNLLAFPIVHVLTNENELEGIGYFHLPRNRVTDFLDGINNLRRHNQSVNIDLNLNNISRVNRCLNISELKFKIERGI
ncbi:MAG: hypothetical protein HeimC3_39240 [Candidatus Heimdallarchaeota archaeon LC_3]|nr:MAG: hypothetical protein HeimC3_39240 [Candidatus Heimdallarchaeota archaeon LC_3]